MDTDTIVWVMFFMFCLVILYSCIIGLVEYCEEDLDDDSDRFKISFISGNGKVLKEYITDTHGYAILESGRIKIYFHYIKIDDYYKQEEIFWKGDFLVEKI